MNVNTIQFNSIINESICTGKRDPYDMNMAPAQNAILPRTNLDAVPLREQSSVRFPGKKTPRDSNPLGIEKLQCVPCCEEIQHAHPVLICSSEIEALRRNTSEWGGK